MFDHFNFYDFREFINFFLGKFFDIIELFLFNFSKSCNSRLVLIFFLLRWLNRKLGLFAKVTNALKAKLFYSVMIRYVVVGYVKLVN